MRLLDDLRRAGAQLGPLLLVSNNFAGPDDSAILFQTGESGFHFGLAEV